MNRQLKTRHSVRNMSSFFKKAKLFGTGIIYDSSVESITFKHSSEKIETICHHLKPKKLNA